MSETQMINTESNGDGSVESDRRLHILVLTDRDWTHPQGGGTGTHLHENVRRWTKWGHRVTMVAGGYPGSVAREQHGNLEIRRSGSRATVFPRTILRGQRALPADIDVTIEIVNGITFLTPLWLRTPRVALVHHVHKEHYVREMGQVGRVAAAALETLPLKALYRDTRFVTVSDSTATEVAELGVPRNRISVAHNGVDTDLFVPGIRSDQPTLLYLGRLKRYKRIEMLLAAVERMPGVRLDIAGDGDHRPDIEREIADRGLSDRVVLHGFVGEEEKLRLLQSAWLNVTASSVEGWSLVALEAAACGTPTVAMAVGGLREAVVHESTGLLADTPEQLANAIQGLVADSAARLMMGRAAQARAEEFSWNGSARLLLNILQEEAGGLPVGSLTSQRQV